MYTMNTERLSQEGVGGIGGGAYNWERNINHRTVEFLRPKIEIEASKTRG